jgi:hypothetical protein
MIRTATTTRATTCYVRTEDGHLVLTPGEPTRLTTTVGWVVWHSPELAGVLVPVLLALVVWTVWPLAVLLGLVSAGTAIYWVARDVRRAREYAAIKAGLDLPPVVDTAAPESGQDTEAEGTKPAGDGMPAVAVPEGSGGVWP